MRIPVAELPIRFKKTNVPEQILDWHEARKNNKKFHYLGNCKNRFLSYYVLTYANAIKRKIIQVIVLSSNNELNQVLQIFQQTFIWETIICLLTNLKHLSCYTGNIMLNVQKG